MRQAVSFFHQPILYFGDNKEKHKFRIFGVCLEGRMTGDNLQKTGITGTKENMEKLEKEMNETTGKRNIRFFTAQEDDSILPQDYTKGDQYASEAWNEARKNRRSNNLNKALQLLAVLGTMALVLFKACSK